MRKLRAVISMAFAMIILAVYGKGVVISGRITDRERQPIEFATVRIGGTAIGTNSDLQGKYSLNVAEKDTIEVIFSCIGFRESKRRLINPKDSVTLNVTLEPFDTELAEVTVIGQGSSSGGMQNVGTESLKISPDVSGGSVEALISTMAGVNSNNEMSSQYSVRGGSYDENSVYINGVEIYRPQLMRSGQQEGLSIINPAMTGNIRFSSGGFPARYSDKMSSALDITYREPEAFEGSAAISLSGGSLSLGQSSSKFSQLHGARIKKNNSLLSSLETRGEYDPLYFDYQTNMTLKGSDKFSVNFLGNVALNRYKFKPADRETNFGTSSDVKHFKVYFDGLEDDRFETWLGALSATFRPGGVMSKTTFQGGISGFVTDEFVSYDISGEYWLDQAGTTGDGGVGGELGVGKYMEHSRTRLKASVLQAFLRGEGVTRIGRISGGLNLQLEKFRDRTREWEWRDSSGYSLPNLPESVHLIYNLFSKQDISTTRFAAWVEDAIGWRTPKADYSLTAGLRFSYLEFNKEFLVSPRVNLNIRPLSNDRWNYRVAFGWYYQSPFYKEYRQRVTDSEGNMIVELNRGIKSPRSIQVLAGAEYTFRSMNRPFKLSGEAYYKNLSNLISYEYDNLKVVYSGVNDSKGYIMGLDLKLFGQFVPGSDSWVSFSLMKAQQTLNGVKCPMPGEQRYSFSLFFNDYFPKIPKLKFSLRGVFADGLTMTPPGLSRDITWFRSPAYKRVDMGITYHIIGDEKDGVRKYDWRRHLKAMVIGLDIFNLFDISNVSSYYWVTDVNNIQYAVPNYLTRRQVNIRLAVEF